eukprot:SM000222S07006  [mRNA]  locus=s222:87697:88270:+ [translate_table: standard]
MIANRRDFRGAPPTSAPLLLNAGRLPPPPARRWSLVTGPAAILLAVAAYGVGTTFLLEASREIYNDRLEVAPARLE